MPGQWAQQWINKAEADWIGLSRLAGEGIAEVADIVAFLRNNVRKSI